MSDVVLLIEDDFDLLWMINKLLSLHNYEVLTAVTGTQGLDLFSRHAQQICAVVLDLTLPDMDGEQLLKELKKPFPDLPVIITSGLEDLGQKKRLSKIGASAYLTKPFDLNRLVEVLKQVS